MLLSQLNKNDSAKAINLFGSNELKKRFQSLGIYKDSIIVIENISLTKSTITIKVDRNSFALRMKEAETIEVKII